MADKDTEKQANGHPREERRTKKLTLAPMNNLVYDFLLWAFTIVVDLFFREIHPRSSWKIPRKGPVIFVAAPHANQVCWT
jgi:glycerol-3-phosphate O-acyltransferase / dihydroxyacetone phosphate acyltransferase